MIPKIIHRIWVGKPMPEKYVAFGKMWEVLHPDWEVKLWSEDDLRWLTNQHLYDNAEQYVKSDAVGQYRSDVARYEILHRFGGVYVDCDVEPLKPFDGFLNNSFFAGWEKTQKWVGNTVLGSVPNHSLMKRMIDVVPETSKSNSGRPATWLTGPRVLTAQYFRMSGKERSDVVIYPQQYFFPYSHWDVRNSDNDPSYRKYSDSYSVHHWGHARELTNRPLVPVNENVSLSVAIMAHQKRAEWVPDIARTIGGDIEIVWDKFNDRHETGARAMGSFNPDCTHHLVVQDDVILPQDFRAGVENMLKYVPDNVPVSLYFGGSRPLRSETRSLYEEAIRQNAPFIVYRGPFWGPGIILPTSEIPSMLAWYNKNNDIQNYDRRITRYFDSIGRKCWYTMPSLVDHRDEDNKSLVGHGENNGRHASYFIGPRSALDVDWSGPRIGTSWR